MHRVGTGGRAHYERHNLCNVKIGSFPQVATSGRRIALLCADKTSPDLYFLYVVDFDKKPIRATRTRHQAGRGETPRLVKNGETFGVE
jgi:hypothetical protein